MGGIVTLTINPVVDVSLETDELVSSGKVRCQILRIDPGGGGVNVARAVRRLGGEATALVTSGGPAGQRLCHLLDREGVPHEVTGITAETRQNTFVFEREGADRFHLVLPGPQLETGEWRGFLAAAEQAAAGADYLVASGSLPPDVPADFYARLARVAAAGDSRFVLDTSGEPLCAALEERVWLVKPNRSELEEIAGRPLTNDEREDVARRLVAEGRAEIVVTTVGGDGSITCTGDGSFRTPSADVTVRSEVGAGDSFLAGLVLSLQRGRPLPDACRYAAAAAGSALSTPGAELCSLEDTQKLYRTLADA